MKQSSSVIVTLTSTPEHADAVQTVLQKIVAATRDEAGCLRYDLYSDDKRPHVFVIVGEFTDLAAIELHDSQPYLRESIKAIKDHTQIQVIRLNNVN